MSRLRQGIYGTAKFYSGGLSLYPQDDLYREMSFISYYFHWSETEVMSLTHTERRRWCSEISGINKSLNPSDKKKEKSIFDMKPTR